MNFEPTPTQAMLLFGLLARHGECAQAELMPAPSKADREALVGAKLIGIVKEGRTFYLALSDAGWGWASDHLAAELPTAHGTLHDLLARLGDHLARSGETLADFIGTKPETPEMAARRKDAEEKQRAAEEKAERVAREKREKAEAKARAAEARPATKRKPSKPKAPTPAALRKRIGEAYLAITGRRMNESVKLSRLRCELADLDRATLDAALGRILQGDRLGRKKAMLMRHDDPAQIAQTDRNAAFAPGGEPFHVIWIAS